MEGLNLVYNLSDTYDNYDVYYFYLIYDSSKLNIEDKKLFVINYLINLRYTELKSYNSCLLETYDHLNPYFTQCWDFKGGDSKDDNDINDYVNCDSVDYLVKIVTPLDYIKVLNTRKSKLYTKPERGYIKSQKLLLHKKPHH
jgi:hypothetical protein